VICGAKSGKSDTQIATHLLNNPASTSLQQVPCIWLVFGLYLCGFEEGFPGFVDVWRVRRACLGVDWSNKLSSSNPGYSCLYFRPIVCSEAVFLPFSLFKEQFIDIPPKPRAGAADR
jgi:hypothetical protein